jgi:hypothetical protein
MLHRVKKAAAALVVIAAIAVGGAAIGSAATSSGSSTTTTTTVTAPRVSPPAAPPANMPAHGTAAHEDAEKPVTGDAATKAQAAAVEYLGGGTAGEVTTDFTQNGYEVTVTKSDGSTVEVHLDSSFTVMQGPPGGGFGH